jgi:transposase
MGRPTRRTFSAQQKLEIVMALMRVEKQLTALARGHGVDHTTICRWRDQMHSGALDALDGKRQPPDAAAQARIGELERALGRKTLEVEILWEASRRLASERARIGRVLTVERSAWPRSAPQPTEGR